MDAKLSVCSSYYVELEIEEAVEELIRNGIYASELSDEHLMPFNKGCVDFEEVVKALREVGYRGLFNLEIPGERKLPLLGAKLHYVKACYDYLWQL